ncbi:MAG: plastocyanin/azurin family copper-binding protein, partial [bacterium]
MNKKFYGCFKFVLAVMLLFALQSNVNSATVTILVSSNQFTPSNVNVNVGDSIKFQWVDGFHTTTCDGIFSGTSLPPGATAWDETMSSGTPMYTYRITVPGTYNYVCMPHAPGMAGTIVATGASSIFLSENFDYPAGDSLGAHGWVSFSGGSTNVLS